jgi:hypothetical protein
MDSTIAAAEAEATRKLEEKRRLWEEHRRSPDYEHAFGRLTLVTEQFIETLRMCWMAASRAPNYVERSVVLRLTDDMLECAVIQHTAVENTARNTARRELRYLLELGVKALFVDQQMPTSPFEHRLAFFERRVSTSGVTPELNDLQLEMLDEDGRRGFIRDMGRAYGLTSNYVHPSVDQIRERIDAAASGVGLGFDSAEVVASVADQTFDVYGLVLVLILHSLGATAAGDVLEGGYGEAENWLFRRHPYVAKIDEYFDYKAERAKRLERLRQWRASASAG